MRRVRRASGAPEARPWRTAQTARRVSPQSTPERAEAPLAWPAPRAAPAPASAAMVATEQAVGQAPAQHLMAPSTPRAGPRRMDPRAPQAASARAEGAGPP